MMTPADHPPAATNRRSFLKGTSAAVLGGAVAATLARPPAVHAAGDDTIKVALIGCGGRGCGAAVNAMRADKGARLTVLADAFPDQLSRAKELLAPQIGEQMDISDDRCFSGFEAYRSAMMSDADVVLLCTPPHFRPDHLKAAIDAGKHVFCEKPVAVDPTGVRSVLETSQAAKDKGLNIVSGLCWRYDLGVRETMKRIEDGAIGDIVAVHENYLTGTLWHRGRQDDWSEMEYQLRNWLYFTWLSGDHIVEQHIHSLDKALWLMGDKPPARCFGLGGRQVRTEEQWGHIYDHFAVCYEWDSGQKCFAYTRQMRGCAGNVDDYVLGTKGQAVVLKHTIDSGGNKWQYKGDKPSMYDVEHQHLFKAIRDGDPINNGEYMSNSTLMAIIGREACYTGQIIEWKDALHSSQRLGPKEYAWGDLEIPPVALPGVTTFS